MVEGNNIKLNQDKCHLIKMKHKCENLRVNTGSSKFGKTMIKNLMGTALISTLTSCL